MKNSRLWASLIGYTLVVAILFGLTIGLGRTPVLGLDLRGGLSVIYATAEPAGEDELIVVRDLMRDQLESFGIAEPDVRVEGDNIIVDLPGVDDQSEAFEALNVSGIVELRPVLQCIATAPPSSTVPGSSVPGSTVPGSSVPTSSTPSVSGGEESALGAGVGSNSLMPRLAPPVLMATPETTVPVLIPDTTPRSVRTCGTDHGASARHDRAGHPASRRRAAAVPRRHRRRDG